MVTSPTQKGFTLIELLVVIAIIGVLSSIVLSSLNTARNKGADAAVRANLDGTRAQAELFYDSNGNRYYGGSPATDFCSISGSIGTPAVKGAYTAVVAAAEASGATVNTTLSTAGTLNTTVTCHACSAGQAGTSCAGSNPSRWAISAKLKTVTTYHYCVDSTGFAGTTTDALAASDAICG